MIAWLVETLIVTSGLMLLVLLLRDPVRQTFGAKAAYALWLLPALRMIMPSITPLMPKELPIPGIAQTSGALSQLIRDRVTQLDATPVLPMAQGASVSWPLIVVGLWLIGALGFAIWQILTYRRFCRKILADARIRRSPARGIKLMASTHVKAPMAFGLTKRFIVFPDDALTRFDVEEHAMALAHELAHHHRGDLIANAAALGFLALHWCNPIAWYAHRAFRNDQEMACDADVIDAIRDRGLGHAYGRALVKCASGREFSAICHLTTVDRLKRRLSMLSKQSPSTGRRLTGIALTGAVVLSGLALTASGEGMAAQVGAKVSNAIPSRQDLLPSLVAIPDSMAAISDSKREEQDALRAEHDAQRAEADAARAEADAEWAQAEARDIPVPPAPPAPPAMPAYAAVPPAPPVPPMPPMAPMAAIPPAPPMPPAPPTWTRHKHVVRNGDYARYIPSQAEIDAMVPIVEVSEGKGCAGTKEFVNTSESNVSVDGRTRKKISIRICGKDIAREARAQALQGLQEARNDISREQELSLKLRNEIMADLDREIAKLRVAKD